MTIFFIQSHQTQKINFERLSSVIKRKQNTVELKDVLNAMHKLLSDKAKIETLSKKYSEHFTSSVINWQMEYDIATKILNKEKASETFTYVYELTNYCFYYLLLPDFLKETFFLLHGLPIHEDADRLKDFVNKSKDKRYIVYKSGQEFVTSYIWRDAEIINKADRLLIEKVSGHYKMKETENAFSGTNDFIYVIQLSTTKK